MAFFGITSLGPPNIFELYKCVPPNMLERQMPRVPCYVLVCSAVRCFWLHISEPRGGGCVNAAGAAEEGAAQEHRVQAQMCWANIHMCYLSFSRRVLRRAARAVNLGLR